MQKVKRIESKRARDSARGESCTFNIVDVCCWDWSTTILAHLANQATGKTSGKEDDVGSSAYCCYACHLMHDGQVKSTQDYIDNKWWYESRALKRTIRRMIDNGTITIGG